MLNSRKASVTFLVVLITLALGMSLGACRSSLQKQGAGEEAIVARINNYQMTASDFKDRVEFILASKYLSVEPNEAKEELLDELITRNVLLQEAQKRNFDKQKAFMREIERYWEQSLIKALLKKKSEEVLAKISVEENEMIDEYRRMKLKVLAHLFILSEQKIAEQLSAASADNFDQVQEGLGEKIISGESPNWWTLGDLPRYLEEPLFSLKAHQVSAPIACGNNWAVIKVLQEEETQIEPFQSLAAVIKKNIQKRKQEEALDEWIKQLKQNVALTINQEVLRGINLE